MDRKEIIWFITLVFLCSIYMGIAPEWYSWYSIESHGIWMKDLYSIIDGNALVNIPICFVIFTIFLMWYIRIWNDYNSRGFRFPLAIFGMMVMWYKARVEYADIITLRCLGSIDYRMFITILLGISIIVMIVKTLRKQYRCLRGPENRKSNTTGNVKVGFSADYVAEEIIPESIKKYAQSLLFRLKNTDTSNQSYAVGITGEWGTGKTQFLKILTSQIKEMGYAEIVMFNPWMCRTPEQVTRDFFSSLRKELASKYTTLSKSIKEYAEHINNITLSSNSIINIEAKFPSNNSSLAEMKEQLSDKFSKLPKKIIVVIDDVDRLERDEVFEVLRLIRNTADLKNVVYLVAYDKEYVTAVLGEKEIKDPNTYLEKIFPIEIHLPKVEDFMIWDVFKKDMIAQDSNDKYYFKWLFRNFTTDDRSLIIKVLDNFRRAKRFARLFMLNINHIHSRYPNEISISDYFWLELLHLYDTKAYKTLADNPLSLLYLKNNRTFRLKDGITNTIDKPALSTYTGDKYWKEDSPKILDRIWGRSTISKNSICYIENYNKYFSLSISPFALSNSEFLELFNSAYQPEDIINNWIKNKRLQSIIFQFSNLYENDFDDNKFKILFGSILYLCLKTENGKRSIIGDVKEMIRANKYKKFSNEKTRDVVISWISNRLNNINELQVLSIILNRLYQTIEYNQFGEQLEYKEIVISNDDVCDLLQKTIKSYLISHEDANATEVIREDSELFNIFKNCCVNTEMSMNVDDCTYKQVAYDVIIQHFAKKELKPSIKEYEEAAGALFYEETPTFRNIIEEQEYYDNIADRYDYRMRIHFGDSYKYNLEEFKQKCFV